MASGVRAGTGASMVAKQKEALSAQATELRTRSESNTAQAGKLGAEAGEARARTAESLTRQALISQQAIQAAYGVQEHSARASRSKHIQDIYNSNLGYYLTIAQELLGSAPLQSAVGTAMGTAAMRRINQETDEFTQSQESWGDNWRERTTAKHRRRRRKKK